jgi:hypothetical protein
VNPAAFWGTPAPRSLPPAPRPFVPKPGVGVKEEDEPSTSMPKKDEPKKDDAPRIPKPKLPFPDVPDESDVAKKAPPKSEPIPTAAKTVEQYIIPAEGNKAERPAEVKVGFFNHSEREITLEINGEMVKLPSEQYVTLRLKRTFAWSEKGQKATEVVVPPDADGMEIVFRK